MSQIKVIDTQLLDATTAKAKLSPRLRMNYNFHADPNDPVNRLLNAMETGSYFPPHRHCNPDKDEIVLLLRGKVAILIFDDTGQVTEKVILEPQQGCYGAEIPAGVWHGLLVLASGSVVYEIKHGPYAPISAENVAPWAPDAADTQATEAYMKRLQQIIRN